MGNIVTGNYSFLYFLTYLEENLAVCWQNIFQAKFPRILFSIDCRLQQARLVSVSQCVNTVSNCWMISEAEANMVWAEIRAGWFTGSPRLRCC